VILCDAGPLVALGDRTDPHHDECNDTLDLLAGEELLTTWACLAEAMHLVFRFGGHAAQDELWEYIARGVLLLRSHTDPEWSRMRVLMARYANVPMDLADASLVVSAERTGIHRIFTLDGDFRVYLINDKDPFDIVP